MLSWSQLISSSLILKVLSSRGCIALLRLFGKARTWVRLVIPRIKTVSFMAATVMNLWLRVDCVGKVVEIWY